MPKGIRQDQGKGRLVDSAEMDGEPDRDVAHGSLDEHFERQSEQPGRGWLALVHREIPVQRDRHPAGRPRSDFVMPGETGPNLDQGLGPFSPRQGQGRPCNGADPVKMKSKVPDSQTPPSAPSAPLPDPWLAGVKSGLAALSDLRWLAGRAASRDQLGDIVMSDAERRL